MVTRGGILKMNEQQIEAIVEIMTPILEEQIIKEK